MNYIGHILLSSSPSRVMVEPMSLANFDGVQSTIADMAAARGQTP